MDVQKRLAIKNVIKSVTLMPANLMAMIAPLELTPGGTVQLPLDAPKCLPMVAVILSATIQAACLMAMIVGAHLNHAARSMMLSAGNVMPMEFVMNDVILLSVTGMEWTVKKSLPS